MMEKLQGEKVRPVGEYVIALAYSNIQSKKGLPVFVSGIVCTESLLQELDDKNLPRKKNLIGRVNKFLNLKMAFDDASEYLTGYEIVKIKKLEFPQQQIENAYSLLINILMKTHLKLLSGNVRTIVLRGIDVYDKLTKKMTDIPFSTNFFQKLLDLVKDSNKIMIKGPNQYNRLLDIAKIHASSEYYRTKFYDGTFIKEDLRKSSDQFLQIIKASWNSPPIDTYSNYNVGPPSLIIRKSDPTIVEHVYLNNGKNMSLVPLARFCKGTQRDKAIVPCVKHTVENPFGWIMNDSSSEYCWNCRHIENFDCSACLYRKPFCNGFEVKCGNFDFAGNICCNLFAVYITRFGSHLKVGTAFLPNVIGRLLEQGAGHALVLYPFEGIMTVHQLEKQIKEYLQKHTSTFSKYGITNVYRRAPPSDEKLKYFLTYNEDTDYELLSIIQTLIKGLQVTIENHTIDLKYSFMNICDFRSNFVHPPNQLKEEFLKPKSFFGSLKGNIIGYRGSFVFLDSGNIIDLRELQGYVVRGKT